MWRKKGQVGSYPHIFRPESVFSVIYNRPENDKISFSRKGADTHFKLPTPLALIWSCYLQWALCFETKEKIDLIYLGFKVTTACWPRGKIKSRLLGVMYINNKNQDKALVVGFVVVAIPGFKSILWYPATLGWVTLNLNTGLLETVGKSPRLRPCLLSCGTRAFSSPL